MLLCLLVHARCCASLEFACQSCCVCLFTYSFVIVVVVPFDVVVFVCLGKVLWWFWVDFGRH